MTTILQHCLHWLGLRGVACRPHRAVIALAPRRRIAVLAAWAVWALAPAASAQTAVPVAVPLRVGVVGPFTGASADFGVPMLNVIKLAVDEINAVGGYLGRPL